MMVLYRKWIAWMEKYSKLLIVKFWFLLIYSIWVMVNFLLLLKYFLLSMWSISKRRRLLNNFLLMIILPILIISVLLNLFFSILIILFFLNFYFRKKDKFKLFGYLWVLFDLVDGCILSVGWIRRCLKPR